MNTVLLYQQAKAIHRVFVLAIITLGLSMMTTGFFMKNADMFVDFGYKLSILRAIHSYLSIFFGVTLFIMSATGLYLFLFPLFRKNSVT